MQAGGTLFGELESTSCVEECGRPIQRRKIGITAADMERIRALASNLNSGFLNQQESQLAAPCGLFISRRR
jgi:hypothetical protein